MNYIENSYTYHNLYKLPIKVAQYLEKRPAWLGRSISFPILIAQSLIEISSNITVTIENLVKGFFAIFSSRKRHRCCKHFAASALGASALMLTPVLMPLLFSGAIYQILINPHKYFSDFIQQSSQLPLT